MFFVNQWAVWLIVGIALFLAIVLDLWLLSFYRQRNQKKIEELKLNHQGVFILGQFSPLLTWFSQRFATTRENQSKQDQSLCALPSTPTYKEISGVSQESFWSQVISWIEGQGTWLQISILFIFTILYCWGFLDLGTTRQLPGNESELFQATIAVLINSLQDYHRLPLWNPYVHTGLPYIADPMLHIYNPVVTLPVLLFGILNGYKIALLLSFFLAAVGMWRLGRVLGFGKLPSLWIGLMYTFAGQPVARFFQGEYLFVFGFAWIPWIIGNLFLLYYDRKPKWIVYCALSIALLYHCGNLYYPFLIVFIIAIFFIVFVISRQSNGLVPFDKQFFLWLVFVGLLTTGLIAIHLFPAVQFYPWVTKGEDVQGSHTLFQIWLDYTSKDTFRPDAYQILPAREEFYAYIGVIPFWGLLLFPLALWKRDRRQLLFWVLVIVFVYFWVAVDQMPWKEFFYNTKFLRQFRHVLRPLIFGSMAIFILAGYGLDSAWKVLAQSDPKQRETSPGSFRRGFKSALLIALFVIMGIAVWDVFTTNRIHITTLEVDPVPYQVMDWLKKQEPISSYIRIDPNNQWYLPVISNRLKFIDMWYPFEDIRRYDNQINLRPVQARPHYLILGKDQSPSEYGQSVLVHEVEDNRIYRLVESLPMAFKVNLSELKSSTPEELKREDVIELNPLFINTDSVELIEKGDEQDILVVLITNYPGWRLRIDGKPAKIENAGGYLATPMMKGVHKYRFDFQPFPFYLGALISLISLGIALVIIREDLILGGKKIGGLLASIRGQLREFTRLIVSRLRSTPSWLISALYREGVIELQEHPNIPHHSTVSLLVIPQEATATPKAIVWKFWKITSVLLIRETIKTLSLPIILFIFAASIYLISRTISLTDFPIYFFTDEAIQTVSAADLVRDGFYGSDKIFLPTYFPNGSYWNLSLSVYVQVLPYLLFGKSVFVTRFTSLLLSGLMVLILVHALRKTIGQRAWWSLILFLAVTPTWFLHSRTAFETVLFSGLYAGFLGAYLLYLQQSPRYLYLAILMAALAFYAYSPGQVVIAVSAVALFVADFRYHWQNRALLGKGLLFILLLAVPYLRFLSYHHEAPFQHLRNLDSYWFYDLPFTEKVLRYLKEYLMGLNPYYWFIPHSIDLNRHTMKGYGHLGLWNLPFIVLGLIYALIQMRRPQYRVFLIAWLAMPSGAALVGVGITRLLAMVMPMAVFATLGWEWILSLIPQIRWQKVAQVTLFVLFSGIAFSMTNDSLRNGPTWYEDYGLYGMQYGARQLFEQKIPELLARDPQTQLFVSSLWANGADVFVRYFLTPQQAQMVSLGSIDSYLSRKQALDERTIFILTAEELRAALASPKMRFIEMEDEILYPDGKVGFYIVRLAYVDNVDELFAREFEQRRQLVNAHVIIDGISAKVRYSQIDDGELGNLFDQKPETLMRGREANPFILEFEFSQPQSLKGLKAQFGSMDFELVLYLYPEGKMQPIELRQEYRGLPPDPAIEFIFPKPATIGKLRLEIYNLNYGEIANIHLRELKFLK